MKKVDEIKKFIIKNKPTHKELVMFIVIQINELCTIDEYVHNDYRGYYSTNFTKWKRNGQVRVNDKGEYHITPIGARSKKGLYSLPASIKIKRLERALFFTRKNMRSLRLTLRDITDKIEAAKKILE